MIQLRIFFLAYVIIVLYIVYCILVYSIDFTDTLFV